MKDERLSEIRYQLKWYRAMKAGNGAQREQADDWARREAPGLLREAVDAITEVTISEG
jgi:hypothetical protein